MEQPERNPKETDPEETGISEHSDQGGGGDTGLGGQGGEGHDEAADISVEGEHGQTQVDAPDDDANKSADGDDEAE